MKDKGEIARRALASCTSITSLITSPDLAKPHFDSSFLDTGSFRSVTHLYLTQYTHSRGMEFISFFFPYVTHLAGTIYTTYNIQFQQEVLSDYGKQLVMVVVIVFMMEGNGVMPPLRKMAREDERVYLVTYDDHTMKRDWMHDSGRRESV